MLGIKQVSMTSSGRQIMNDVQLDYSLYHSLIVTLFLQGLIFFNFKREWISPAAVLWMLNELLENEEYRHLIENLDWYILPVHNPDGYVYSYTRKDTPTVEGRFWRASRNNSGTCVSF